MIERVRSICKSLGNAGVGGDADRNTMDTVVAAGK